MSFQPLAQCQPGETEVQLILETDAWGYEAYWEIVPTGNACGQDVLFWGGNQTEVGCDGAGDQDATGGNGYPSNSTIEVDPFCLQDGVTYDIHYIDDYIDAGLTFELYQNGVLTYLFAGQGQDVFTFTIGESGILPGDFPCVALSVSADGTPLSFDNTEAGVSPGEIAPEGGNCGLQGVWCEGNLSNSLWVELLPPFADNLILTTCVEGTDFDTQLALYKAASCDDWDSYELITANDDGGCGIANGFSSTMYASCLDENETYYILIDGWNGATGPGMLTVSEYEGEISYTANVSEVTCPLDKLQPGDGNILIEFTGTGSDFTASWTGPNGFVSDEALLNDNNLDPGVYEVEITDACGNVYTDSFEITAPAPIISTFSITEPSCPNSGDGSITANFTGGTGPYTYIWTGPENFTAETSFLTDLNEGVYELEFLDDNDCQLSNQINLVSANDIELNLGQDTTVCDFSSFVLNGPLGFTYEWQDGSENQFYQVDAEELGVGDHSFILNISNEDGCTALDAIIVTVDVCPGIEESDAFQMEAFPNPVDDVLNLRWDQKPSEIKIVDLSGRAVLEFKQTDIQTQINLAELAEGYYVIQVNWSNAQNASMPFVKR